MAKSEFRGSEGWVDKETGAYTGSPGGSSKGGGGGDGAGAATAVVGVLFILKVLPLFIGLIIGLIINGLSRLGIVGKVIITALFSAGLFFLLYYISGALFPEMNKGLLIALILLPTALFAVYSWIKRYDIMVVICETASYFADRFYVSFWVFVVGSFVCPFIIGIFLSQYNMDILGIWGILPAAVVAYIVWLVRTNKAKDYKKNIEEIAKAEKEIAEFERKTGKKADDIYKELEAGNYSNMPKDDFTQAVPTPLPPKNKRYTIGDFVWARWSDDNCLYFSRIIEAADTVKIVYHDGTKDEAKQNDIFYLEETQKTKLNPQGNWKNAGDFYDCEIIKLNQTTVQVKYTEDSSIEELPYRGLIFA